MVALAEQLEARSFEKPVYRRAQFVVPVDLVTRPAQLQAALGVASSTSLTRLGLTNLNRWYDAKVGRWISEDPIGFAAGDANIYRYVGNSPTNLTDPTGLSAEGGNGGWWQRTKDFFKGLWHGTSTATTPPGTTEVVGALECAPDVIRIGDTKKAFREWQEAGTKHGYESDEAKAAEQNYKDVKDKHRGNTGGGRKK